MDVCFGMVCFDEIKLPSLILIIIFMFAIISAVLWRYNHLKVPKHKHEQPLCDHGRCKSQANNRNMGGANVNGDSCPTPSMVHKAVVEGDPCPTPPIVRRSLVQRAVGNGDPCPTPPIVRRSLVQRAVVNGDPCPTPDINRRSQGVVLHATGL
jgi:hypothetical protein